MSESREWEGVDAETLDPSGRNVSVLQGEGLVVIHAHAPEHHKGWVMTAHLKPLDAAQMGASLILEAMRAIGPRGVGDTYYDQKNAPMVREGGIYGITHFAPRFRFIERVMLNVCSYRYEGRFCRAILDAAPPPHGSGMISDLCELVGFDQRSEPALDKWATDASDEQKIMLVALSLFWK